MAVRNRQRREPRWRRIGRWLGGPDSWRRIIATGAVAGVILAFAAALIAGLVGDGGSLDGNQPTVAPVDNGPVDGEVTEEPALDTPTPFEEVPTEAPTEVIEEPTEEVPTDVPAEPTPTFPDEPPPEPTLPGGP